MPGVNERKRRFLGESSAFFRYRPAATPYSASFAGYKDWFLQEYRRPGFTVEAGRGLNPLPLEDFPEIFRRCLGILTLASLVT